MKLRSLQLTLLLAALVLLDTACASEAAPARTPSSTQQPADAASSVASRAAKQTAAPPVAKPSEPLGVKSGARELAPDYFVGKTITLVVNYSPGGPTDLFARLLAEHLGRYVPGISAISVQHVPGGAGVVGTNHLYNVAKKDGTTLGVLLPPFSEQLLEPKSVQFDLSKFVWLGAVRESRLAVGHRMLGIKTADELRKAARDLVLGGLGPYQPGDMAPRVLMDTLGLDYRYTWGYAGSKEARAALLKGEVTLLEVTLADWFGTGSGLMHDSTVIPIAQRGLIEDDRVVRDARLKDVPTYLEVLEAVRGPDIRSAVPYRALSVLVGMDVMARAVVLPPGADPPLAAVLRSAVSAALGDKDLEAASEKQVGFRPQPVAGADAQRLAEEVVKVAGDDKVALQYLGKLAQGED